MNQRAIIGIDVGGTDIKAGLFSKNGDILAWKKIRSRIERGRDSFLKRITRLIKSLEKKNPNLHPSIGVVVPGIIDKKREKIIHSPNLIGWDEFSLKRELEKKCGKRVILENDANGAALGELWKGSGRTLSHFMLLTLGTGLGSGLIINKKLWIGEDGSASELGHTKIVPGGLGCGCGAQGCLEKYFSSQAIERLVKEAFRKNKRTKLRKFPPEKAISPKTVYKVAREGDEVALSIYREISYYLGIAIANVINLLGIHYFILSGGISNAYHIFIPFLKEEVSKNLFNPFSKEFSITKSKLGNRAGATGAAYLALKKRIHTRHR
jgi:glucokinase